MERRWFGRLRGDWSASEKISTTTAHSFSRRDLATRSTGRLAQVNGTWYPGYIARSDSSTLYFKYEATKFKSYEEPIKKADRDDLARLRAGSGSGAPKKKPAARKPAKSPAKKKTVAKPAARKPSAKPAAKPAAKKPAAKKSHEPGVHGLVASIASRETPAQARQEAGLEGEESREEEDGRQEVARQT